MSPALALVIALAACAAPEAPVAERAPWEAGCRSVTYATSLFPLDDEPELVEVWRFDAGGDPVVVESFDPPTNEVEWRWVHTWDGRHNPVRSDRYGPDGEWWDADRSTYTYDADGHVLTAEHDTYDDGIVEAFVTYTRDADGNATSEERALDYDVDWGPDGEVDSVRRWERTFRGGHLVAEDYDEDADGVPERRERWSRDLDGKILHNSIETDGSRWRYAWTWADGRRARIDAIFGMDDAPSTRETWRYEGRTVIVEEDHAYIDGEVDARTTWTYNAENELVRYDYDYGPDGVVDEWRTWSYDDGCLPPPG